MDKQTWKNLIDTMDVSDRWSYNPFKKELVCFWWKSIDDDGTLFKAKAWFRPVTLKDFLKIRRKFRKGYRPFWYNDEYPFETGSHLKFDKKMEEK